MKLRKQGFKHRMARRVDTSPNFWERWSFDITKEHRLVCCGGVGDRLTEMTWRDPFSGWELTFERGPEPFSRWQEVR